MAQYREKDQLYDSNQKFTPKQFQDIVLQDLVKFSYFQSYGVKDPRYQAFLTEVRSDTLKYWDNYYPISCPTARLSEKTS